ncbi:D-inositol 3-phosphate glycosyltransferase [Pseudobythopirellula maris]|uniref:D-inositol 3-phosphate glycosyltransferase n=1 Tax=Pseudobythopirellula maris TaxID=2527991 RepID=A0A5C5ZSN9_9BACT|nr:glycosyltransferase family 4 protein [Pseudobythopirellula maris]TWT90246.1 D-inositol 3-phosphate glycosyltransferase [Pseudobythopirellula maris]
MESRIGWRRALHAAREYDVTVMYGDGSPASALRQAAREQGAEGRIDFLPVEHSRVSRLLCRSAATYYAGYDLWHRRVYRRAMGVHQRRPFDLVHQVNFTGYRQPGDCWRLPAPFIWGPVGGTQGPPLAYLPELGLAGAWTELWRRAVNAYQMRYCPHVRGAARKASVVLSATRRVQSDLKRCGGIESEVELETALDYEPLGPRPPRPEGQPLRILWAGRHRSWKALPLLLKALARLPESVDYRVRVLGVGDRTSAWLAQAERLGVADRIEWLGWPTYRETLPHYRWADVFAFTSVRDTSGTGLLEALAAGAPIVGLDHQGAADLMTPDCAMPIAATGPEDSIEGFAAALTRLAGDPDLLARLSEGARERSFTLGWEEKAEPMLRRYRLALAESPATADSAP